MTSALETFLASFGTIPFPLEHIKTIGKEVYLVSSSAQPLMDKLQETPVSKGLLLGTSSKNEFKATIALLRLIAPFSEKKIVVNEKMAWLFVCGRDVFAENIVSGDKKSPLVLVLTEHDEVLGLAKKIPQMHKNVLHIGSFLKENKQF